MLPVGYHPWRQRLGSKISHGAEAPSALEENHPIETRDPDPQALDRWHFKTDDALNGGPGRFTLCSMALRQAAEVIPPSARKVSVQLETLASRWAGISNSPWR